MKKQLVDPFIPANRPSSDVRSSPAAPPSKTRAAKPVGAKPPAAAGRPPALIDGVVRPAPATSPKPPAYRPPAGPLHLRYAPKPRPAAKAMDIRPTGDSVSAGAGVGVDAAADAVPHKPAVSPGRPPAATAGGAGAANHQPAMPAGVKPEGGLSSASRATEAPRPIKSAKAKQAKPVSTLGLVVGLLLAGVAVFSSAAGQLILLVYAILAIWKRWPSQQTFGLALLMFVAIIITSLIEPVRYLADNLAVYAFLLLCIGTISLAREVRQDS